MKRAIKFVLIFFGYQLLATLPLLLLGVISDMSSVIDPSTVSNTKSIAISISLLVANMLTIWHFIHFKDVKMDKKSLSPVSYRVILETIIIGVAAIVMLGWLSDLMKLPDIMSEAFDNMKNVFGVLAVCLAGPVAEELVFRGGIEGHLLKKWNNPNMAILVSALIFGVIHGNPAQIPFAFLIGLLLGWLYYRSGSLLLVILIHILNNSLSVFMSFLYSDDITLTDLVGKPSIYIIILGCLICFVLSFWRLREMLPQPVRGTETKQK